MRFRILGSIQVCCSAGDTVPVHRPKHRQVLASLLLSANAIVPVDRLIEDLWDGEPPDFARSNIKTYVWGLRRLLSPEDPQSTPIRTSGNGYLVVAEPHELDLLTFMDLKQKGISMHRSGDLNSAANLLGRALDLWTGEPLQDVPSSLRIASAAARLEDERLLVLEYWIDEQLSLGPPVDVIDLLATSVCENPFRERLCGQLMLALYKDGRRASALQTYYDLRDCLADQLGIEPSRPIQDLFEQILAGELQPSLPAVGEPFISAPVPKAHQMRPAPKGRQAGGRHLRSSFKLDPQKVSVNRGNRS